MLGFYQYKHKIKVLGNQGGFVIFADIPMSLCVGSGTTLISHACATASGDAARMASGLRSRRSGGSALVPANR